MPCSLNSFQIENVHIKVALSRIKLCILIKILADSHKVLNLGDKLEIRIRHADEPISQYSTCLCALSNVNLIE